IVFSAPSFFLVFIFFAQEPIALTICLFSFSITSYIFLQGIQDSYLCSLKSEDISAASFQLQGWKAIGMGVSPIFLTHLFKYSSPVEAVIFLVVLQFSLFLLLKLRRI